MQVRSCEEQHFIIKASILENY